jgi:hypothetical protein
MRYSTLVVSLLLFACIASRAQDPKHVEKNEFVLIPREIALPVIVFQPDCPIEFEKVERLAGLAGGGTSVYKLRNRSSKTIRSFTIAYLFGDGTGGSWSWGENSGPVAPGQLVPELGAADDQDVIPLTELLREKLDLRGPMKGVIFYMTKRVEFADGSIYADETAYKALAEYLKSLSDRADSVNRRYRYRHPNRSASVKLNLVTSLP